MSFRENVKPRKPKNEAAPEHGTTLHFTVEAFPIWIVALIGVKTVRAPKDQF